VDDGALLELSKEALLHYQCPVGHRDSGSVEDGLGQLEVVSLGGLGGGLQRVPDLLFALEGRSGVPKLVPLGLELPVGQGDVGLPPVKTDNHEDRRVCKESY